MAFLTSPALRLRPSLALRASTFLTSTSKPPLQTPHRIQRALMSSGKLATDKDPTAASDADWRDALTPQEYHVLRQKGTERPGTGEYDGFYPEEGHFVCRGCGAPLYSAEAKFKSGCGWPAFDKCYKGALKTETDVTFGMKRVEIMCATCGGHLGHVFEGERMTKTNERHCVNSVSVKYVKGKVEKEEVKVV